MVLGLAELLLAGTLLQASGALTGLWTLLGAGPESGEAQACHGRGGRAMIAGLPPGTWFLMAAGTLPAVILVVAAYLVHRDGDIRGRGRDSGG